MAELSADGLADKPQHTYFLTKAGIIGVTLTLNADGEKRDKWEAMKETNTVLQQFGSSKKAWEESENPVISSIRSVTDFVSLEDEGSDERTQRQRMPNAGRDEGANTGAIYA